MRSGKGEGEVGVGEKRVLAMGDLGLQTPERKTKKVLVGESGVSFRQK